MTLAITTAISSILAVAALILVFIFFVPKKSNRGGFGSFLHNVFNFNNLVIEKVIQGIYIFFMCFCLIYGVLMLFSVEQVYHYGGWYSSGYYTTEWVGYYGILILILGPIAIRISFEIFMMFILMVKNTIEINKKLKDQNEVNIDHETTIQPNTPRYDSAPYVSGRNYNHSSDIKQHAPNESINNSPKFFCSKCGAQMDSNGFCRNCISRNN